MTKEMDNMNTYVVEGGIGKCTAFTALIPKLRTKIRSTNLHSVHWLFCK
jgi:hypothetical protein